MKALNYLEAHVTNLCNLNCKGCSHFSNVVPKENADVDIETFERDFKILSKLFDRIFTIRLLGGEPLLVPNLVEYVAAVREAFPNEDLRVVSNGLLIPKADDQLFIELSKYNITFDISCYPPTYKIKDQIEEKLARFNIGCNISPRVDKFHKRFNIKGDYDAKAMFDACPNKDCTFVRNGKLSLCPPPQTVCFLNDRYGLDIRCEEDVIDLTDPELTADKILEYKKHHLSTCRFCSMVPEEFDWCASSNPALEDWLVEEALPYNK